MTSHGSNHSVPPQPQPPGAILRPLRPEDFGQVEALSAVCENTPALWASQSDYRAWLALFPEGQLALEYQGDILGICSSLLVESADLPANQNFADLCGKAELAAHDPQGDALYVAATVWKSHAPIDQIAHIFHGASQSLAKRLKLRFVLLPCRLEGYAALHTSDSPAVYAEQVAAGTIAEPQVDQLRRQGFTHRAWLPNFFPPDQGCPGSAMLMEWRNPESLHTSGPRPGRGTVRVAAAQYEMRAIESFHDFAAQCSFFAKAAGDFGADFLLYPELLTTQLMQCVPAETAAASARRLGEFTDSYIQLFTKLATTHRVNIIGGTHLQVEANNLYNIAYLFHRDGRIEKQYKIHITPSEVQTWNVSAGNKLRIFKTDRSNVAILICYDSEFPELGRIAAAAGAQVIFVPYNTDLRQGHLRVRYCSHARAIENHIYMVLAGAVGNLPGVAGADIHYAQAAVLTPSDLSFARDAVASEAIPNTETLLVQDLDLDILRRTRRSGTVRPWFDRRTDLYQVRFDTDEGEHSV